MILSTAHAQEIPRGEQAAPLFRTRVDVNQLEVAVLDQMGEPVRGLKAADFEVLEDRKSRPIVGVSEVAIPPVDLSAAAWTRNAGRDVATNTLPAGRLVVIIMDDATIPFDDPYEFKHAQDAARLVVDLLGPDDLAAILFPRESFSSQDFTRDRAKLRAAIDRFSTGFVSTDSSRSKNPPQSMYNEFPYRALAQTTEYLAAVPNRRKVIVFLSGGGRPTQAQRNWEVPDAQEPGMKVGTSPSVGPTRVGPAPDLSTLVASVGALPPDLLRGAMLANVSIYPIDPGGLRADDICKGCADGARARVSYLQALASLTGGHSIVNTNSLNPGVMAMMRETSSYYLIGYQTVAFPPDGRFHWLDVRVNRPGVTVQSHRGFWAARTKPSGRDTTRLVDPKIAALDLAISELLPNPGLAMLATAAPFWAGGKSQTTLAVVQDIRLPAAERDGAETFDLQTRLFTVEGKALSTQEQTASLKVRTGGTTEYEALARVEIKPGRYELRMSARGASPSRLGSVYADVTVPDFAKETLSLSGVVIGATPGPVSGPRDAFAGLLPVVPTARRDFEKTDDVVAFMRVYQGAVAQPVSLLLSVRIVNERGVDVVDLSKPLDAHVFVGSRPAIAAATYPLPLATLAAGNYLLTLESTLSKLTVRREVRFTVK